jgi:IS5 family transposase
MKQTRKGNAWHFGMKLHIGTDVKGRVHSVTATHAAVADITQLPHLVHGEEAVLYGDQAYWKEADRQAFAARGVRYRVNRRAPSPRRPLTAYWRAINRARSRTRACGEHPFHVVKHLWGFAKVRYRGLAKNLARAFTLFALANLYQVRRHLLPLCVLWVLRPERPWSCGFRGARRQADLRLDGRRFMSQPPSTPARSPAEASWFTGYLSRICWVPIAVLIEAVESRCLIAQGRDVARITIVRSPDRPMPHCSDCSSVPDLCR